MRKLIYRLLSKLRDYIDLILHRMENAPAFNIALVEEKISIIFRTPGFLKIKSRERKYVTSRQVLATVLHNNTNMTLGEIGKYIQGQGHANMIHSFKTIDNLIDTNIEFKFKYYTLIKRLNLRHQRYVQSNNLHI